MKKLLTVPPHFIDFGNRHFDNETYYFTSDPKEGKIGSGGGTANLVYEAWKNSGTDQDIWKWLASEKRLMIHAGGQSRRLPAYASVGKVLAPIPVFRWKRGQKINQTLLDLQLPLYEEILAKAPPSLSSMVVSGDALTRCEKPLPAIPEADIVFFGLWEQPEIASNHGVFFTRRQTPGKLEFMLQKPSSEKIQELQPDYLFLIDIGVWLLSPKAMQIIFENSGWQQNEAGFKNGVPSFYDMYSNFGPALGSNPTIINEAINQLSVAIVPLQQADFYHFGTSAELISSSSKLQNLVKNQQEIWQNKIKPTPDIFTQNACTEIPLTAANSEVWIENSHIGPNWVLHNKHLITGVPKNDWNIQLSAGTCLDIIPIGYQDEYCVRVYEFNNPQLPDRGEMAGTAYTDGDWFEQPVHPVFHQKDICGSLVQLLVDHPNNFKELAQKTGLLSAAEIGEKVNLDRQFAQRKTFLSQNLYGLAKNWKRSVFYQSDLKHTAELFANAGLDLPEALPETAPLITQLHDNMFRSEVIVRKGGSSEAAAVYEGNSFGLLRKSIIDVAKESLQQPVLNVLSDQIVWGRSPVRLDLAGGWTDTPPYCLINGGKVVNMAVELNGQPPLQVFIKPSETFAISLRSIDLGVKEEVFTYEELAQYNTIGSAFSIPKAALALAGFLPDYAANKYKTLEEQLKDFGAGIEISLLAAIPKGSGLGTSSILASTVLGALNDFCQLNWDKHTISSRTLVLEQMLTTGGGWQDQLGGVFGGVKLLESQPGIFQQPTVHWAPDHMFTDAGHASSILLYYTGITRVAKSILAEIVKGMFLNGNEYQAILEEMRYHAVNTYESIQQGNLQKVAEAVGYSWILNNRLDKGTNPPETQAIIDRIKDYIIGCKLLGAGGGGYMYIFAKDVTAAAKVREILTNNPLNSRARFVDWKVSADGFKVTRS